MAAQPALISAAEYLRREAEAENRHEYVAGTVYAMAGASRNHLVIQSALSTEIGVALRGTTCLPLGQDTKIWISSANTFYYPDSTISCPPNFIDDANGIIDNPTVVFEVLSPSTARLDRSSKFVAYKTLESLRDYVLIDSERKLVEIFSLEREEWVVRSFESGLARLPSLDLNLKLDELYRHVIFG